MGRCPAEWQIRLWRCALSAPVPSAPFSTEGELRKHTQRHKRKREEWLGATALDPTQAGGSGQDSGKDTEGAILFSHYLLEEF